MEQLQEDTAYLCLDFISDHEDIKTNTPYTKDPICRIEDQVKMDDPVITMEVYIQLEAEKAYRRGQTFNRETATYDALSSKPEASPRIMKYGTTTPRAERHLWFRYEGHDYTDAIIQDYEERLGRIYDRRANRIQILDFEELTEEIGQTMTDRLWMDHSGADGQIRDPLKRLCHCLIAFTIAGRGLTVVVIDLTMIDMDELVRLYICERLLDVMTWVALRPERQQVGAAVGDAYVDPEVAQEGVQADLAPIEATLIL
ncbi:hypothetical protein Tco_0935408 [Tanacetum coccineum]